MFLLDIDKLRPSGCSSTRFSFRFLTHDQITELAENVENCLAPEFVERVLQGDSQCLAAFDGTRLASYSWYATGFVDGRDHLGISMELPVGLAYMYNAYTHPDYRGHRLFGGGVALAARSLAATGTKKIVTTVVRSNFASLRSCRRMGFVSLGKMWAGGRKERKLVRTPAAALNLGIQFGCRADTALAAAI